MLDEVSTIDRYRSLICLLEESSGCWVARQYAGHIFPFPVRLWLKQNCTE
jgi:hypothetical protein